MNVLLNNVQCLFSPRKVWEGRCVRGGSQDSASLLWCICMFVNWGSWQTCSCSGVCLERHVWNRHALLFWHLSEKTHGQLVKRKHSVLCLIQVLPCCPGAVFLTDKTSTFLFWLGVCRTSSSEMTGNKNKPENFRVQGDCLHQMLSPA